MHPARSRNVSKDVTEIRGPLMLRSGASSEALKPKIDKKKNVRAFFNTLLEAGSLPSSQAQFRSSNFACEEKNRGHLTSYLESEIRKLSAELAIARQECSMMQKEASSISYRAEMAGKKDDLAPVNLIVRSDARDQKENLISLQPLEIPFITNKSTVPLAYRHLESSKCYTKHNCSSLVPVAAVTLLSIAFAGVILIIAIIIFFGFDSGAARCWNLLRRLALYDEFGLAVDVAKHRIFNAAVNPSFDVAVAKPAEWCKLSLKRAICSSICDCGSNC